MEEFRSGDRRHGDFFVPMSSQDLIEVKRPALGRDQDARVNQESHADGCTTGWFRVIASIRSQYSASGFGADRRRATRSDTVNPTRPRRER
jgi:hypothetical protein